MSTILQFPSVGRIIFGASSWLRFVGTARCRAFDALILPLLLLPIPIALEAQDFTYTTNNGTLAITGYNGSGGVVTIPSVLNGLPVTSIADGGFSGRTNLTGVTIPNSVVRVGDSAFLDCASLTNVVLQGGVTNIGSSAFRGCTNLKHVALPSSVLRIEGDAFSNCAALVDLVIPEGVTELGAAAFYGCTSLQEVIIPASVTNLGLQAFRGCTELRSVMLGRGVESFHQGPCCGYEWQFFGCLSLTNFTVDPRNPAYSSRDGVLFSKAQDWMLVCPPGRSGGLIIPNTVRAIAGRAFQDCTGLTSVSIGSSLEAEGLYPSYFFDCTSLTNFSVDPLNPNYSSVDGVLFDKNQQYLIVCPKARLGAYSMPGSVTTIYDDAFAGCKGLTGMTMGNRVAIIGSEAFYGCTSLTDVTIGNGVTYIGRYAFGACTELRSVFFAGNVPSVQTNAFVSGDDATVDNTTVYHLPGTTLWGPTFGGAPTAQWLPQVRSGDASFGVRTNQFGFTVSWAPNTPVVVEASTTVLHPVWVSLLTNTLSGGSFYFSDPQWTNYPSRIYRLRSP